MPLGKSLILINRYLANPLYKNITWFVAPYATVVTRDRYTGEVYSVPMGAYPLKDGQIMIPMSYGQEVNWVTNVLADGGAQIWYKGKGKLYNNPHFIPASEAYRHMASTLTVPYKSFGTTEFMVLDPIDGAPVDAPNMMKIVAHVNKSIVNPIQLRYAGLIPPMAIVEHTGRKSGRAYRTPVMALVSGKYGRIALPYGTDTDWVKNIQKAGQATLISRRKRFEITEPRINSGVVNNLEFTVRQMTDR